MARISEELRVPQSANEAWKLLGDLGGYARWIPFLDKCEMSGDIRMACLAGGVGVLKERILSYDDERRRYEFQILDAPFPVDHHLATVEVLSDGEGCRVVWSVEIEPETSAEVIEGGVKMILQALEHHLQR